MARERGYIAVPHNFRTTEKTKWDARRSLSP